MSFRKRGHAASARSTMLREHPSIESARLKQIGNDAFGAGQFDEAARLYERAIDLSSANPILWTNRALALLRTGHSREASVCADGAIERLQKLLRKAEVLKARASAAAAMAATGTGPRSLAAALPGAPDGTSIGCQLREKGYAVVDGFAGESVGRQVLDQLKDLFSNTPTTFTDGQVGGGETGLVRRKARGDKVAHLDKGEQQRWTPSLPAVLASAGALATAVAAQDGMGFELTKRSVPMCAVYPGNSARYIRHVDNPRHAPNGRVLTCLWYLNFDYAASHGGQLRLYPDVLQPKSGGARSRNADEVFRDVEPRGDRLVFFWSDDRTPHEVLPAHKHRWAVSVWFHGNAVDADKTARPKKITAVSAASSSSTSSPPPIPTASEAVTSPAERGDDKFFAAMHTLVRKLFVENFQVIPAFLANCPSAVPALNACARLARAEASDLSRLFLAPATIRRSGERAEKAEKALAHRKSFTCAPCVVGWWQHEAEDAEAPLASAAASLVAALTSRVDRIVYYLGTQHDRFLLFDKTRSRVGLLRHEHQPQGTDSLLPPGVTRLNMSSLPMMKWATLTFLYSCSGSASGSAEDLDLTFGKQAPIRVRCRPDQVIIISKELRVRVDAVPPSLPRGGGGCSTSSSSSSTWLVVSFFDRTLLKVKSQKLLAPTMTMTQEGGMKQEEAAPKGMQSEEEEGMVGNVLRMLEKSFYATYKYCSPGEERAAVFS